MVWCRQHLGTAFPPDITGFNYELTYESSVYDYKIQYKLSNTMMWVATYRHRIST